jgi:hypothetical protein
VRIQSRSCPQCGHAKCVHACDMLGAFGERIELSFRVDDPAVPCFDPRAGVARTTRPRAQPHRSTIRADGFSSILELPPPERPVPHRSP